MEAVRGGRRSREMSPDRFKICPQHRMINRPTFKRVQVVYYLSRNGQLEHPHYMEVTHLSNQNLRLKDVIDRLIVLRGKGMPSMYSWSCKRSYKNGYVWNDLSENDIIYPSEGADYILKGSEVIQVSTEKFQNLQIGNTQPMQNTDNFQSKRKLPKCTKWHREMENHNYIKQVEEEEEGEDYVDEFYEEKINYRNTPNSRCSRGVSTDVLQKPPLKQKYPENLESSIIELTLDDSSPPSTTSSTISDKANNESKRFEDGDPVGTEPVLSRNSILFQLIACGGSLPFRSSKNVAVSKQQTPSSAAVGRKSNCSDHLHKGVLCKKAAVKVEKEEEEEDDDDQGVVVENIEIKCMSENPRFGNLQAEEKEYFSGSIVEAISNEERVHQVQPSLKKSSSYNEQRSSKAAGLAEAALMEVDEVEVEEPKKRTGEKSSIMKGKCIPRKKSSSSNNNNKQQIKK